MAANPASVGCAKSDSQYFLPARELRLSCPPPAHLRSARGRGPAGQPEADRRRANGRKTRNVYCLAIGQMAARAQTTWVREWIATVSPFGDVHSSGMGRKGNCPVRGSRSRPQSFPPATANSLE